MPSSGGALPERPCLLAQGAERVQLHAPACSVRADKKAAHSAILNIFHPCLIIICHPLEPSTDHTELLIHHSLSPLFPSSIHHPSNFQPSTPAVT